MTELTFTAEADVKGRIGKIKNGNQAGLDGIKSEMYKALGKSDRCLETMVKIYNDVLD